MTPPSEPRTDRAMEIERRRKAVGSLEFAVSSMPYAYCELLTANYQRRRHRAAT